MDNRDAKTLGEFGETMNDVVNHLSSIVIPGYPKFQLACRKLKQARTMPQLIESWSSFTVACQKLQGGNAKTKLLLRSIANNTQLAKTFSHIKSLDDLLIAQQKFDFLANHLLPAKLRLEKEREKLTGGDLIPIQRKIAAYQSLEEQIIHSDSKTTLGEILKEDSLFLNAKLKSKEQLPGIQFSENDTIQSILIAKRPRLFSRLVSAEESDSKMMLDKVRDELIDPRTVLSVGEFSRESDGSEAFAVNKALFLNLKAGCEGHETAEINRLLKDVEYLLYRSKDHEENHRLMINRIEEDLAKEERRFRKSGFFKKSRIDFEKTLNGNDKKYWYPRLLRSLSSILINPLDLNESDLKTVLLNIEPDQKMKRELPVRTKEGPLKLNHLNVYFSRSIQAGDVSNIKKRMAEDSFEEEDEELLGPRYAVKEEELKKRTYYVSPEKGVDAQGKKITQRRGEGAFGYVKSAGTKVKLYQDQDLKISKHKWVEKNIKKGTLLNTRDEIEAIKDVAPDLRPNSILIKSHSKKGNNRHKFFMKDAGDWNLMNVILGKKIDFSATGIVVVEKKIDLSANDILNIFKQLVAQISLAAQKGRVIFDIKPVNILIDPETKKVIIIDHGNSPKLEKLGTKGGGMGVTLEYAPRDMRGDNKWMVYQVGLVMALLIAPKSISRAYDGRFQLSKPKVLEEAAEAKSIPPELIQLIKSMIVPYAMRSTLDDVNAVLDRYQAIKGFDVSVFK